MPLILHVLPHQGNAPDPCHPQKQRTDYFQPQRMEYMAKGPRRRLKRTHGRAQRPAAFGALRGHLRCHPSYNPELACGGKLAHALDFNSVWGYNRTLRKTGNEPFR